MSSAAERLVKLFTHRSTTVATCESLTGGSIGSAITDVPGASAIYRGGIIAYHNKLKTALVGVDAALLKEEGVVSELVAVQMANGVQARCDSEWAIATTGVAGPTELEGQPVGAVWFAVVGPKVGMSPKPIYTEYKQFSGDRAEIREAAVQHALEMIMRVNAPE